MYDSESDESRLLQAYLAHMRPWKANWKLARPKKFHASCLRLARDLSQVPVNLKGS